MSSPDRQPQKTIRQLRQARGWSQQDLALRLGVDQGAISYWELGLRRPYRRHQQRLADLFGLDVEQIVFGPVVQASQEPHQHGMG